MSAMTPLLALLACAPNAAKPQDSDSGYLFVDTGLLPDDSADSGDSGLDTDTASAPIDLGLWPSGLDLAPGGVVAMRLVSVDADGVRAEGPAATWSSSDATIAAVDPDGVVTALAAGAVTVRARVGDAEAAADLRVRDDGTLTVRVVDPATGAPLEGASARVEGGQTVVTGADGVATIPVEGGAPVTLTVWSDDSWDTVSVVDIAARALVLPLRAKASSDGWDATIAGSVDHAGVPAAAWDEIGVGIAFPTVQGPLGALFVDALFGAARTVTVFGADMEAPSNLFLRDTPTYAAPARAGTVGAWALAGPVAVADATAGLAGAGDALALLLSDPSALRWGWTGGGAAADGSVATLDLAPASTLDGSVPVSLPALPDGFAGDEPWLVLVADARAAEGWVPVGMGVGRGAFTVAIVEGLDGATGRAAQATTQVGGVGSGGAAVTVMGTEDEVGAILFPEAPSVPTIDAWAPATRALTLSTPSGADWVRVRFTDDRKRVHDLLVPPDWSGVVPTGFPQFHYVQSDITVTTARALTGHRESWAAGGALEPRDVDPEAMSRNTRPH